MSTTQLAQQQKSYNWRPRKVKSMFLHDDDFPMYNMVEFSAANEHIPLKENWSERWCSLPYSYTEIMNEVINFEVRPDDIFVNTFMKCGTTWMQETAWLLTHDLDFATAKSINISERCPNLDGSGAMPREETSVGKCDILPSPRIMKTHLPSNLMPRQAWSKKVKIIFVARNVKDCFISSYHFLTKLINNYIPMEDYAEEFMNNSLTFMPYLERVVDYWQMRNEPNIFFTTYEEMKRNLPTVLQRLCVFLNRPQLTKEELKKMVEHLSFEKMRDNKHSHIEDYMRSIAVLEPAEDFRFMRRGIVGAYKDEMPAEIQQKLDAWTSNILSKHGLSEEMLFGNINNFAKSSL